MTPRFMQECRHAVDSTKALALRSALEEEKLDEVIALIDELSAAELNFPDNNGQTPVLLAASRGHAEVLRKLLLKGASPNEMDPMGTNAVLHASCNGHLECLKILIDNNAILDALDNNHESAAFVAAANGHEEILSLLIEKGADLNIPDKSGYTPAHMATKLNHAKVLKMLLEHGADFELVTKDKHTCEEFARGLKSKNCLKVLQPYIDARNKKREEEKKKREDEKRALEEEQHAREEAEAKAKAEKELADLEAKHAEEESERRLEELRKEIEEINLKREMAKSEQARELLETQQETFGMATLRKLVATHKSKHFFVSAVRSALGQDSAELSDLVDCFSAVLDSSTEETEAADLAESVETILKEIVPRSTNSLLFVLQEIKTWSFELALKEALLVDQRPLRRSRLMIVGEGAAGKTSFFRALTGQERHKLHLSTVGLDTSEFMVQKSAQEDIDRNAIREAGVEVADYESGSSSWNPLDKELGEADRTLRREVVRRVKQTSSSQRASSSVKKTTLAQRVKAVEGIETDGGGIRAVGKRMDTSSASDSDYKGPVLDSVHHAVISKTVVAETTEEVATSKGMFNLGFSKSEAEALAFSVWDYGGQRVFQTVQHLFLSRYGVYVLAFDLRKLVDSTKVDNSLTYLRYWLRQIGMIASGAPLVLLGTHIDWLPDGEKSFDPINDLLRREFSSEPAWASLQHNGEQKLCFFPVINEKSDPNISRLRHLLEDYVEKDRITEEYKESYVNWPIPLSWLKVCDELKRLEREGESYIYREKLQEVAQNCGVFSHLAADDVPNRRLLVSSLLDRFNMLGMVVHINEPGLDDVVVLNPQWLLDLIVCIVRDFELHKLKRDKRIGWESWSRIRGKGIVNEKELRIFWKEQARTDPDTNKDNIKFLTNFLIKIGVMCNLPRLVSTKPQEYLLPAILSSDAAVSSGSYDGLKFASRAKITLTFHNFLPEGLLMRLVVALALQVSDSSRCNIMIEESKPLIEMAPSVFSGGGAFCAAVPVGPSGLVCLLTQSGANELAVSLLGEASGSTEAEAALLGEVVEALRNVLNGVIERFYRAITFDSSITLAPRKKELPSEESTSDSLPQLQQPTNLETEPDTSSVAEEIVTEEQVTFRAKAIKELSDWIELRGGVKLPEVKNATASILFTEGWDCVEQLREALMADNLPKEETDQYFGLSNFRSAFRKALEYEMANMAVVAKPEPIPQELQPSVGVAKPESTRQTTDVFISYAWGLRVEESGRWPAQERVKTINVALQKRGLVTWFDSNVNSPNRMTGHVLEAMAAAIENTACAIVIITDMYRDKVNGSEQRENCKKEFKYAESQLGSHRMVPVVAEKSMLNSRGWKGTLGLTLCDNVYVNASGDTSGPEWESTMDELSETVKALVAAERLKVTDE